MKTGNVASRDADSFQPTNMLTVYLPASCRQKQHGQSVTSDQGRLPIHVVNMSASATDTATANENLNHIVPEEGTGQWVMGHGSNGSP
jgi:hypothetical protein